LIATLSFASSYIWGLWWEAAFDTLRAIFAAYGDLEEAVFIIDKSTGLSKDYGFDVFCHIGSSLITPKEPSKKINKCMIIK
jgi:heterogeneous nuclear ribonucleoprotein A1/A3